MLSTSTVMADTLSILDPVAAGPSSIVMRAQRWAHELELSLAVQTENHL
jgi:hypothetical protein